MKRFLIAFLAWALMVCAVPISASAAAESASSEVSYSIYYGYTVNIPASVDMSNGNTLEITATDVFIDRGNVLTVTLDIFSDMDGNGKILLKNDEGFGCSFDLFVEDADGGNKQQVTAEDHDYTLAQFRTGDTTARSGGTLTLKPIFAEGTMQGTYSGTLKFLIEEIYVGEE